MQTDGLGRAVSLPERVHRIVSLAPSITESLFALGAGDRLVGVTDFCDYPEAARAKPTIGGPVNPSWETILSLRPDLILATTAGNDPNLAQQAERLGLTLFFLDTPGIEFMLQSLHILGKIVGEERKADQVVGELTRRLERLEQRRGLNPRPRVLYLVWGDPIVVPGRESFLDEALRRVGAESITSDAPGGWPTYDLETILVRKPDWILATRQNAPFLDSLSRKAGWESLEAVRAGRIGTVSESLERPSPRMVAAMEEMQELLYKGIKK